MPFVVLVNAPDPVESERLRQRVARAAANHELAGCITREEADLIWSADSLHRSDLESIVHGTTVTAEEERTHYLFEDAEMDARNVASDLTLEGGGCVRVRAFNNGGALLGVPRSLTSTAAQMYTRMSIT